MVTKLGRKIVEAHRSSATAQALHHQRACLPRLSEAKHLKRYLDRVHTFLGGNLKELFLASLEDGKLDDYYFLHKKMQSHGIAPPSKTAADCVQAKVDVTIDVIVKWVIFSESFTYRIWTGVSPKGERQKLETESPLSI